MHCNVNRLIGYRMEGIDGEMGKVEEFYFDDQAWIIVYLVVKTGNWLSGRKVLISPYALIKGAERTGILPVELTREQIRNSPDIDTDRPVSRQKEIALHEYFSWQSYWATGFYEGGIWGVSGALLRPPLVQPVPVKAAGGDPHLRSTHAITGYHIETTDGKLGHLRDFIIDDETWHIEFLIIEMYSWLEAKRVLIARKNIKNIQWASSKVLVDVTSDELRSSPGYDESELFQEEASFTIS